MKEEGWKMERNEYLRGMQMRRISEKNNLKKTRSFCKIKESEVKRVEDNKWKKIDEGGRTIEE